MRDKSLRSGLIALTFGSLVFLAACASPTTPSSSETASAADTAPRSELLLDAQANTVLDQLLAYPQDAQAQVSSSIITIPPGVETGLHRHDAPMYAYILEGELTVTYDGGITKVYRAGDAIMEAVGTAHNGANAGDVPVKVLVVNMGAEGVANTVKLP